LKKAIEFVLAGEFYWKRKLHAGENPGLRGNGMALFRKGGGVGEEDKAKTRELPACV
jgi:hypothetical protein